VRTRGPRTFLTALLWTGTIAVLCLMYLPLMRIHQGWEDEIFWLSTCINLVHHAKPVPSVLADFPGTHSPLLFYGPTLFWLGAGALKLFGATERVWRTLTFAGNIALLGAVAVLFRRLRHSWRAVAVAVFVFSLSMFATFFLSLPGREDAWTLAMMVFALAIAAGQREEPEPSGKTFLIRWSVVGLLFGAAASTTPRCWPLLFFLYASVFFIVGAKWLRVWAILGLSSCAALTLLLLPLHTTPWAHILYVQHASSNDPINISPVMGGTWRFGHSFTQAGYALALLTMLGFLYTPRLRQQDAFGKWLMVAGTCNLLCMIAIVAGALNAPTYWSFPLEIAVLLRLLQPITSRTARRTAWAGFAIVVYLVSLRAARELPAFTQWSRRDPAVVARTLRVIPPGSVVYGPVGQYFYPVEQDGSDYRYLVERTTGGLLSTPGALDQPSPLLGACHRAAYLVWPIGAASGPMPALAHATLQQLVEHRAPAHPESRWEHLAARVPAGRADPDVEEFTIYRLVADPQYCASIGKSHRELLSRHAAAADGQQHTNRQFRR
jgi:hypothetical protein